MLGHPVYRGNERLEMSDANAASSTRIQTRKVRRLVIEEDRLGDWRIRVYFDKGRCKLLGETYDSHRTACLGASGIRMVQNWFSL